jgi:hypothetical protein
MDGKHEHARRERGMQRKREQRSGWRVCGLGAMEGGRISGKTRLLRLGQMDVEE